MGFGAFSSESTSRYDQTNVAQNQGQSEVGGNASAVNVNLGGKYKTKGGAINVTLTDQGAVNAAMAVADKSIRSVELFGANVTGLVEGIAAAIRGQGDDVLAAIKASNSTALNAVTEAGRGEVENIALNALKWGALALAGYLAFRAVMGFAK